MHNLPSLCCTTLPPPSLQPHAPPATPCERFASGPGYPPCKVNELRWCQTDLAANVFSWPRFIADDMRYGLLDSGHGASHDGFMADVVRTRKWKVRTCCLEQVLCESVSEIVNPSVRVRQKSTTRLHKAATNQQPRRGSNCAGIRLPATRTYYPCLQLTCAPVLPLMATLWRLVCALLLLLCCRWHVCLVAAWWTTPPPLRPVQLLRGCGTTRQQAQMQEQVAGGEPTLKGL